MREKCPLCRRRRVSRGCPAKGHRICAVCCATKRLVEIDCPRDCRYLVSAQAHPPAVIQRRQERDLVFLLPTLADLSERQQSIVVMIQLMVDKEREETPSLVDADVERAAGALAATLETASRGIIYEHAAGDAAADRLRHDIEALIRTMQEDEGLGISDAGLAEVMRCIERGAREARKVLPGDDKAYLDLVKRVKQDGEASAQTRDEPAGAGGPGLIVPG